MTAPPTWKSPATWTFEWLCPVCGKSARTGPFPQTGATDARMRAALKREISRAMSAHPEHGLPLRAVVRLHVAGQEHLAVESPLSGVRGD